jgi:serine/threonine-protein kinase
MARTIASSPLRRFPAPGAALLAALLATLCLRPARADSEDSARAQRLFDDARTLMKDGQYAEACPKLVESQRLDPGGGTILNLGICLRQQGRNVEAWVILNQALAQARRDGRADREKTAEKQLAWLRTVVSRLSLRLAPSASPEPVTVTIDGVPLSAEQLDSPLPLDPGTHEVSASAPHQKPWSVQIRVEPTAGEQQLTIPALQPETLAEATPAPLPRASAGSPPATPLAAATTSSPAQGPRTSRSANAVDPKVYVAAGVGAVALGLGTYFGVRALTLKGESNRYWDGQYCTAPSCIDDWNQAQTSAHISSISLGVGVLALGVGAYFLLQPSPRDSAPAQARIQVRASQAGAFVTSTTEF